MRHSDGSAPGPYTLIATERPIDEKRTINWRSADVCNRYGGCASSGSGTGPGQELEGKRLFEQRDLRRQRPNLSDCHSQATGTVSPEDAQKRFAKDPNDPLFLHDGSDDGLGHGTSRMRTDATVLMTIGWPKTSNSPTTHGKGPSFSGAAFPRRSIRRPRCGAHDGRASAVAGTQATGAIQDHAQGAVPSIADLQAIAAFQKTNAFFSSSGFADSRSKEARAPALPHRTDRVRKARAAFLRGRAAGSNRWI